MGAAKFPEEIVERGIESSDLADQMPLVSKTPVTGPKPKLLYCPLCFEGHIEEDALDRHIAGKHGKQHVYLKVNDQVVRDVCWLRHPVRECVLVILKVPDVEITVSANDEHLHIRTADSVDLVQHLGRKLPGSTVRIDTQCGPFSRSFTIYQGKQPAFRSARLDDLIIKLMGRRLRGEAVDLIRFQSDCLKLKLNELERRYLDGIVEYCHGLTLEDEGKGHLARPRLETSMDLLIPFRTVIAEDLRHALALRMNCFSGQWDCSDCSPFRIAERFFCDALADNVKNDVSPERPLTVQIDTVSRRVLDALRAFRSGDLGGVLTMLDSVNVRDRNDEDKLNLIEARLRAKTGDICGAKEVYEKFIGHPVFGREAETYRA